MHTHSYSQLEILSSIQEIRGPLRIQNLPMSVISFPYLRNLRKIDTTNSTFELLLLCRAGEPRSKLGITWLPLKRVAA